MTTYTHTSKGGPVRANDADHAASILARREYGKRGTVGALRHDCDTVSAGRVTGSTWEAFIGCGPTQAERRRGLNCITGRNIWIYS